MGALTIIANFSVRMFLSGVSHQQQQTCFDINMPGAEGLMVDGNTSSSAQLQGTQGDCCCLLSGSGATLWDENAW